MSAHLGLEELADAAGGVLGVERSRDVQAHLATCPECSDTYRALSEVTELLAAEPAPTMPTEVAARLDAAVMAESRLRASSGDAAAPDPRVAAGGSVRPLPRLDVHHARPTLGTFGADLPHRSRRRLLLSAVGACAAAAAVGFAGYVLSASAGLNEPVGTAPAVVSSGRLGPEAHSIEQRQDLSPHRFSQAWQCARDVTDGRITAITSAVVDGQPALLVYLAHDGRSSVTVVTGCDAGQPVAGPSTTLPR